MRLPGVVSRGTPGPARVSPARGVAEGQAYQRLGDAIKGLGQTLGDIQIRKNRQELNHAEFNLTTAFDAHDNQFTEKYMSPDSITTDIGQGSGPILGSEASLLTFMDNRENMIQEAAASITDEEARNNFIEKANAAADKKQARLSEIYNDELFVQTEEETKQLINLHLANQDYDAALEANERRQGPDVVREAGRLHIHREKERDQVDQVQADLIAERSPKAIAAAEAEFKRLHKGKSDLDTDERLSYMTSISNKIDQVKGDKAVISDVAVNESGFTIKRHTESLNNGIPVDFDENQRTRSSIEVQIGGGRETNQNALRANTNALVTFAHIQTAMSMTAADGQAYVNDLRANAQTADEIQRADNAVKGYNKFLTDLSMDSLIAYQKERPAPINFPGANASQEQLAEYKGALSQRLEVWLRNNEQYGKQLDFLTSAEKNFALAQLQNMTPQELMMHLRDVSTALGPAHSRLYWDSLQDSRFPSISVVGGQMLADVTLTPQQTAELEATIVRGLEGQQALAGPDSLANELFGELTANKGSAVAAYFNDIFPAQIGKTKNYSNMFWSLLASDVLAGNYKPQSTVGFASHSEDLYTEMLGSHGKINGSMVLAPSWDTDMNDFEDMVDVFPSSIIQLAQPMVPEGDLDDTRTTTLIRDNLRTGDYVLESFSQDRQKYVIRRDDGSLVPSKTGAALLIHIDPGLLDVYIAEGTKEQ